MTIRDAFVQTQWFRLLAVGLARAGVQHVIVSPGSRSTPLVCAILEQSGVRVTVCIDERAAGFVALGSSRATGEPCAVVCTSGTAAAHYYPAVIEAAHSGIPLLILSADRPSELQGNGAAQTTDQTRLFGTHVRGFFEFGTPQARPAALHGLVRKVAQAVALAKSAQPGPVHLNAQAFKPLEPVPSASAEEVNLQEQVSKLAAQSSHQFHTGRLAPSTATAMALCERWAKAHKPVLFCGPAACPTEVEETAAFASLTGWPVLAEITHPLRQAATRFSFTLIDGFELVVRSNPEHLQPDLIVSLGVTATSSAWLTWLTRGATTALDVICPHTLVDPVNRATTVVQCDDQALFEAVNRSLPEFVSTQRSSQWRAWAGEWQTANDDARRRVQAHLDRANERSLTEAVLLADVSRYVQANEQVMFGNSLPIRLAETFFRTVVAYRSISQRGVSGIDGLIAGAIGSSLGTGKRTWLLLGDVSAVHDLSSLRLLRELESNVVVIIVDNDGGRIFDTLPVTKQVPDPRPWTTPHRTPFGAIAQALGLPTVEATTRAELNSGLSNMPSTGPLVVWARVEPDGAVLAYQDLLGTVPAQGPV